MIVFSLTLFLFSSFTFFYKIRISKKPRTPRSTSWWVCLFKQCQCSCSRCTDFLCWLGGMSQVSPPLSRVDSPVSSKDRARAKHFARVPALEGALTCHLCPCRACFHGISREISPWEPCASLPGVFSPAQWVTEGLGSSQEQTCRQQGQPGSSGNDAKANLPCSAFPRGIL